MESSRRLPLIGWFVCICQPYSQIDHGFNDDRIGRQDSKFSASFKWQVASTSLPNFNGCAPGKSDTYVIKNFYIVVIVLVSTGPDKPLVLRKAISLVFGTCFLYNKRCISQGRL